MEDTQQFNFDAKVEGTIHDSKYDYYGKKLALCTSEGIIYIYDVSDANNVKQITQIKTNQTPIWRLDWAHPRFGSLLASSSYDKQVSIWQEQNGGVWREVHRHNLHTGSVNCVSWAPWERGAILAACGSDGKISISVKKSEDSWNDFSFDAHQMGVNSVSFQPFTSYEDMASDDGPRNRKMRLVSCSCDKTIKVWEFSDDLTSPKEIITIDQNTDANEGGHTEWVRDVSWSPMLSEDQLIASCGEDNNLFIWKIQGLSEQSSQPKISVLKKASLGGPAWRVSWNLTGSLLAVSHATKDITTSVTIFREDENGEWEKSDQDQE